MAKPLVYIDGQSGTTGLQIADRLGSRTDIELLKISDEKHRDVEERKRIMNEADIVFFCLPDDAAKEAAELVVNPRTRIIDAATVHRVAPGWDYGIPELSGERRAAIAASKRVANPGCHASGFVIPVYALVEMGVIPKDLPLTAFSLTGYSGGGKKMIAEYEDENRPAELSSPRIYGLTLKHKHIPEMQKICGLTHAPVFLPVVDDYYKGMAVTLMLHNSQLTGVKSAQDVQKKLEEWYADAKMVQVHEFGYDGMIAANTLAGSDKMQLIVNGHEDQTIVTALFDNLGKGASGSAVQNMNIMLGFDETAGLNV
ncbi:N-acetyl-gamma-glutamyl-phosphate reductase [[Clostridium] aminophilum]|uniref:N-acetyl-gamma-glutamyl-phosphate reductase n=1 Tax=[Clostridium] aminophilum TaxID=1526 RepID=UPI00332E9997